MGVLTRLGWQSFVLPQLRVVEGGPSGDGLLVSVIIPARDEEANIGRCLSCLQEQNLRPECFEVIVVDDGSTDRTRELAEHVGGDAVRVISAGEVPEGWLGKPHACHVGAAAAKGGILMFIDADTFAEPGMLSTCARTVEEQPCDLLSIAPHEEIKGVWERLVMPWGFALLALSFPFRKINDPNHAAALANGQCMVFRRTCYDAIGGHAAIRGRVQDDVVLARRVKQHGFRL